MSLDSQHLATLLLRPDLGKKAYRLKCRFRIEAHPRLDRLIQGKNQAADLFVADLRKKGFEYVGRFGVTMSGPFPAIDAMTLRVPPQQFTARQMLPLVAQGARFLPEELRGVQRVPDMAESESWEYELAMVFVHKTILVEYPDPHEERN